MFDDTVRRLTILLPLAPISLLLVRVEMIGRSVFNKFIGKMYWVKNDISLISFMLILWLG